MERTIAALAAIALASGCAVNTREHINTGAAAASVVNDAPAPKSVPRTAAAQASIAAQARSELTRGLDHALRDTGKLPSAGVAGQAGLPLLPSALYKEPAMDKLLDVTKAVVRDDRPQIDVRFSTREIVNFAQQAAQTLTLPQSQSDPALFAVRNSEPSASDRMLKAYVVAYQQGKFVTRDGSELARPSFKGGIGNPTITGFLTVALEAMFDAKLRVPVFYEKDDKGKEKWLNASGKKPTAAVLDATLGQHASDQTNVTLREARAIQVFAGMAADRSAGLSSVVVRMFGGVEVSVIIGGKFSIGDNETLAKIVDTWVEGMSRRLTEAVFYKRFLESGEPADLEELLDLIEWVSKETEKS